MCVKENLMKVFTVCVKGGQLRTPTTKSHLEACFMVREDPVLGGKWLYSPGLDDPKIKVRVEEIVGLAMTELSDLAVPQQGPIVDPRMLRG